MQVRLVQTRDEFLELEHDWNDLLARSASDTIFLTWDWLWSWWNAYAQARDRLHILVFRDETGELEGIVPLYRQLPNRLSILSPKKLRFIGDGSSDSDYLDIIAAKGREDATLNEFWKHLSAHLSTWDVLELATIPSGSPTLRSLDKIRNRDGLLFRSASISCAATPLPKSWEEYLARLHPRFRTKVRSTLRQFAEDRRVCFRSITEEAQLGPALGVLFDLHSRRWKTKGQNGVFADPKKRQFYEHFTRHFLRHGWLAFDFLYLDESPIACQLCFRYHDNLYLLQEGFDPQFQHSSAGVALRAMVFKKAIADGIQKYDFLAGLGRHKTQWSASITTCQNSILGQKTFRSTFYVNGPLFIEAVKERVRPLIPRRLVEVRQKLQSF